MYFHSFLDSNDVSATIAFEKIGVTGDVKNNSGSLKGFRRPTGVEVSRCDDFSSFFKK